MTLTILSDFVTFHCILTLGIKELKKNQCIKNMGNNIKFKMRVISLKKVYLLPF